MISQDDKPTVRMPDNYVPMTHSNRHAATSFFASALSSPTETQKEATKVKSGWSQDINSERII